MKLFKTPVIMAGLILAAMTLTQCGPDDIDDNNGPADPLQDWTKLGDATSGEYRIQVFAQEEAFAGYNILALRLLKDGNHVKDADLNLLPMMDMGTMMHSAPFENPASYDGGLEAYPGSVTFIMPTATGTQWTLSVLAEHGAWQDTADFDLDVRPVAHHRVHTVQSAVDSQMRYVVTLREPRDPEIGMNDFEVMVYQRQSMMNFPPATDLELAIEPEMPAMGHGSPNNENPVHLENGHYAGRVNFTMSGLWRVHVELRNATGDLISDEISFDIDF